MKLSKLGKAKLKKIIVRRADRIAARRGGAGSMAMDSAIGMPEVVFKFEGPTTLTSEVRPQRGFKLTRATFDVTLNAVAIAAGVTVAVDSIQAGMFNCLSSNASMPMVSFRYDAIGARINAPKISKGTEVITQFRLLGGPMPADGQAVVTGSYWGEADKD